jgi:hypothetical protein
MYTMLLEVGGLVGSSVVGLLVGVVDIGVVMGSRVALKRVIFSEAPSKEQK